MKKHLIFGAMASMMLLATSCQEEVPTMQAGDEAVVSFNLHSPQIATRLYSDGKTATELQYAVYKVVNNQTKELKYLPDLTTTTEMGEDLRKTVNLKLTTGDTYTVVFWAAEPDAPYNVDFPNKKMNVDYDAALTLSNDETRDAFFNDTTFTVNGSVAMDVELRRPFAQLNIGTNDYTAAEDAGYAVTQTGVTAKVFTTLNLVKNAQWIHTVENEQEVFFGLNDIPSLEEDGAFPVAGYKYLSMNYLLVPSAKEVLSQITLTYTNGSAPKTRTFGQIPVQRNYRTNIYGQLLTSNVDVYVEIIPEYYEDNKHYNGIDDLIRAANVGGEFILSGDMTLSEGISVYDDLVVNLNGFTLTYTGDDVLFRADKNASVTINGDVEGSAIVTKPTTPGNGGNGYIALVKEGCTATFNGGIYDAQGTCTIAQANGGKIFVKGGTFSVDESEYGYEFMFNHKDNLRDIGLIEITGGTFLHFNPANNASEGAGTNYVPEGYSSATKGEYFVVFKGEYENIDAVASTKEELLAAIDNGGRILLLNDIELSSSCSFRNRSNITILGNGHTINTSRFYFYSTSHNITFDKVKLHTNERIRFEGEASNITFKNCEFTGNRVQKGFHMYSSPRGLVVDNCIFHESFSENAVGFGGSTSPEGYRQTQITNCTFYKGLDFNQNANTIYNNILIKGNNVVSGKITFGHMDDETTQNITVEDNIVDEIYNWINGGFESPTVVLRNNKKSDGTATSYTGKWGNATIE